MNRYLFRNSVITLFLVLSTNTHADDLDADAGKELVKENCYSCHGSEVYTRKDRKIKDRLSLTKQVRRCDTVVGTNWFDEEIENAAAHLNRDFYHFKK
jgi:hypothetical protein